MMVTFENNNVFLSGDKRRVYHYNDWRGQEITSEIEIIISEIVIPY